MSIDIKDLPCEEVRGKVDDLIAGLVGFVSACYGKEVSGKKSNTRIMIMVMAITTIVARQIDFEKGYRHFLE